MFFLEKVVLLVHVLLALVGVVVLFHLSDKKMSMNLLQMFVKIFILIVKIQNELIKLIKVFFQHYRVVEFMPHDYKKKTFNYWFFFVSLWKLVVIGFFLKFVLFGDFFREYFNKWSLTSVDSVHKYNNYWFCFNKIFEKETIWFLSEKKRKQKWDFEQHVIHSWFHLIFIFKLSLLFVFLTNIFYMSIHLFHSTNGCCYLKKKHSHFSYMSK